MTSLHVICGLSLPKSKTLSTPVNRRSLENFLKTIFLLENTCVCVLGPWPRAFLSLASRVSVLGKAVLGLGLGFFFWLWSWPWPRTLSLALASSLVSSTPPLFITHTFIAPRCDTIGVPLLWSFRTNVVQMVLSENCDFCLEKFNSLKSASLLPIVSPSSVYVC